MIGLQTRKTLVHWTEGVGKDKELYKAQWTKTYTNDVVLKIPINIDR